MSFQEDLELGKTWEYIISDLLNEKGFKTRVIEEKYNYDIIDDSTGLKYEVKYDYSSGNTDNVAIEIGTKNKPTGLSISLASYWVHIWWDKNIVMYNIVAVYMLKNFIRKLENKDIKTTSNTRLIVIPKEIFKHWGVCYELPKRAYIKYLDNVLDIEQVK